MESRRATFERLMVSPHIEEMSKLPDYEGKNGYLRDLQSLK